MADAPPEREGGTVRTFQDRLDEVGGFGPGFDTVRLVLCYEVLVWHCWVIWAGSPLPGKASLAWMPFELMVPMFFALSGFLVAGSSLRLAVPQFLLNRFLRILPALFAAVLLAALVIGPLLTTLPLADYVSDRRFATYFLNSIGIIRYPLPGVFESAPVGNAVNGSLWTVPWEIGCYMVMAMLMLLGLARRGSVFLALAVGWLAASWAYGLMFGPEAPGLFHKLARFFLTSAGARLIPYFMAGAALYHFRGRVPWDARIAALCGLAIVAGSLLLDGTAWTGTSALALLALPVCAYLVPYLGLARLPRPPGFRGGDYSYGVYVCHFPIVQALNQLLAPGHWGVLLAAAFLPVTLFAMASWHVIEAPVLAQRKRFSLIGRRAAQ
jgi:peptidoglycan/LPS O-acetylase OafA/YrhL